MLPVADISNRRCIYVGLANFSIAITIVTRNSIASKLASFSFDELIPFHRWYTRIGLAECAVHIGYQIWKGYNQYGTAKDSLFYDMEHRSGTLTAIGFLIVYLTSFEIIRRRFFEVFYYSHLFGVLLAVAALFAHQYGAITFLSPAIFLWFADRAIRYFNIHYRQTVTVAVEANENQTFTRILFKKEGLEDNFVPGQYVFLAIRQSKGVKRLFESLNWHPFTISEMLPAYEEHQQDKLIERGKIVEVVNAIDGEKSKQDLAIAPASKSPTVSSQNDSDDTAVSSGVASVHIKGLGNMTKRLLSSGQTKCEDIQVSVDGPFGANSLHFQDYETVLLFSAGVGVTPSLSILKDLVGKRSTGYRTVRTSTIHFLWSLQKMEHAQSFIPLLKSCSELANASIQPLVLKFQFFLSMAQDDHANVPESLGENVKIHPKRVNISEVMNDIALQHTQERVAVQTCGPASFMGEVQNIAASNGWSIRTETFEF
ncbi:hypothetical protein Unana1_07430 [Umbelopsis nana]